MVLSFLITSHNEGMELQRLLNQLLPYCKATSNELVIVDDFSTDRLLLETLSSISNEPEATILSRRFIGSFADQKNFGIEHCSGKFIFQIDADEFLSDGLIQSITNRLEADEFDLLKIPRINIVNNIGEENLKEWGWLQNEHGWLNWPDWQGRLFRNTPSIRFNGSVHESLENSCKAIQFLEADPYSAIIHVKELEKQSTQNHLYECITLSTRAT